MTGGAQFRFDGKVAVVTGSGRGLGRSFAMLLAARGAKVVVNDLGASVEGEGASEEPAMRVVEEIRTAGGEAIVNSNSVSTPEGGKAVIDSAIKSWGRVDIVINNAGILPYGSIMDCSDEMIDLTLATHIRGAISVTRAAWPYMVDQQYGRIVNLSSSTTFGSPDYGPYPTAKSGMIGFTRSLALLGADVGIKANAVMPSAATRMSKVGDLPPDTLKMLEDQFAPEKVAPVVAWLCHEKVPCSGEIFSAGADRVAHVFLSETVGFSSKDFAIESIHDAFPRIMNSDGAVVVKHIKEDMALFMAGLNPER
jgi:NAD(P)-dependent dehydrogenase (short-subunit alcohol dehydrogenase family)